MEGFFKNFRQKFQELKNQKNDALRKLIFSSACRTVSADYSLAGG